MMRSLDRMMAAIDGSGSSPPVIVPYLHYYFPVIVNKLTPFTREELRKGERELRVEALSRLHTFFNLDWVRVTADRIPEAPQGVVSAETMLEQGRYDVAMELTRRFGHEKFVYGRVNTPYSTLYEGERSLESALIALREEPDRCKRIIEDSLPQRLEEVRAWATVGVHGLWFGQWLSSADVISEADYLELVYPTDQIIIEAMRAAGLIPFYHFCGEVIPRLKHIMRYKPTVLGVEEPKKGLHLDIGAIRAAVGAEVCLLGNIDVYGVVEKGTPEEWAKEVERQIGAAGPRRFIVSCGSPITHDTSPWRLRDFIRTAQKVRDSWTQ